MNLYIMAAVAVAYPVAAVVAFFALWVAFVAVMSMERTRDDGRITPAGKRAAMLALCLGIIWDVFCNLVFATVLFFEIPQELTVSARLSRLVKLQGRRADLARWFAVNALNPFCPPDKPHIKL